MPSSAPEITFKSGLWHLVDIFWLKFSLDFINFRAFLPFYFSFKSIQKETQAFGWIDDHWLRMIAAYNSQHCQNVRFEWWGELRLTHHGQEVLISQLVYVQIGRYFIIATGHFEYLFPTILYWLEMRLFKSSRLWKRILWLLLEKWRIAHRKTYPSWIAICKYLWYQLRVAIFACQQRWWTDAKMSKDLLCYCGAKTKTVLNKCELV